MEFLSIGELLERLFRGLFRGLFVLEINVIIYFLCQNRRNFGRKYLRNNCIDPRGSPPTASKMTSDFGVRGFDSFLLKGKKIELFLKFLANPICQGETKIFWSAVPDESDSKNFFCRIFNLKNGSQMITVGSTFGGKKRFFSLNLLFSNR
jgi:hypothetical protein